MSVNLLKNKAISLRTLGKSYREIGLELGIAKSTLSGWLRDIPISKELSSQMQAKWLLRTRNALEKARIAHFRMKANRIKAVAEDVDKYINAVDKSRNMLEMLFVGLYLGDGFKNNGRVGLGNADPKIVLLFVTLLRRLYDINEAKLRAQIFARADQSQDVLVSFWSELLDIPITHFHKTQFDKRTISSKSRDNYHGVCAVVYADIKMQWRILGIGKEMIEYVSTLNRARSSTG